MTVDTINDPIEAAVDIYLDGLLHTPGTIIEDCPKCLGVIVVTDDGAMRCDGCGHWLDVWDMRGEMPNDD